MIAAYNLWQIGLVWVLGSFCLALAWILLKSLDNYLEHREARRAGPPVSQEGRTTAPSARLWVLLDPKELDEVEWHWIERPR